MSTTQPKRMDTFDLTAWPERLGLLAKFVAEEFPKQGLDTQSPSAFLASLARVNLLPYCDEDHTIALNKYADAVRRGADTNMADNLASGAPELVALSTCLGIEIEVAPAGGRYGTFKYTPHGWSLGERKGTITLETKLPSEEWGLAWAPKDTAMLAKVGPYQIEWGVVGTRLLITGPATEAEPLGMELTVDNVGQNGSAPAAFQALAVEALTDIVHRLLLRESRAGGRDP